MERQLRMGGGIMSLEPRQKFLFGGIGKSIKKAVKGVSKGIKSLAKSDLGKAALLAGIGFGIPGTSMGGLFGRSATGMFGGAKGLLGGYGFTPSLQNLASNIGLGSFENIGGQRIFQSGKLLKGAKNIVGNNAGLIGATVLGGVLGSLTPQEQEEISTGRNVEALRSKLTKAYTDLQYDPAEIPTLVANDLSEYTQDMNRTGVMYGGRMGYGDGTPYVEPDPAMMVDTTTFNPIPENADRQEAAEIAKVMMATRGLPREEGEIEDTETMSTEDFMLNEYFKPKREELIENFGLSLEEANNLIREEAIKIRGNRAEGGRMGYQEGATEMGMIDPKKVKQAQSMIKMGADASTISSITGLSEAQVNQIQKSQGKAYGGRMSYAFGTPEQNAIQAAQMEGLPLNENPAGVTELDLRDSGGFIPPVGVKEKADDIPAMLANNEFVFTADAVRGMGDGNVNKGAQRMYDMMKKLEKGGRV